MDYKQKTSLEIRFVLTKSVFKRERPDERETCRHAVDKQLLNPVFPLFWSQNMPTSKHLLTVTVKCRFLEMVLNCSYT